MLQNPKLRSLHGLEANKPTKVITFHRMLAARIPRRLQRRPAGQRRGRCRTRACPGRPQTSMPSPARSHLTSAARLTGGAVQPISRPSSAGAEQWALVLCSSRCACLAEQHAWRRRSCTTQDRAKRRCSACECTLMQKGMQCRRRRIVVLAAAPCRARRASAQAQQRQAHRTGGAWRPAKCARRSHRTHLPEACC
jgi:hypothetical protein